MKPGDIIMCGPNASRTLYADTAFDDGTSGRVIDAGELLMVVGVVDFCDVTAWPQRNVDKLLMLLSSRGDMGYNWIDDDRPERWDTAHASGRHRS